MCVCVCVCVCVCLFAYFKERTLCAYSCCFLVYACFVGITCLVTNCLNRECSGLLSPFICKACRPVLCRYQMDKNPVFKRNYPCRNVICTTDIEKEEDQKKKKEEERRKLRTKLFCFIKPHSFYIEVRNGVFPGALNDPTHVVFMSALRPRRDHKDNVASQLWRMPVLCTYELLWIQDIDILEARFLDAMYDRRGVSVQNPDLSGL